jgi:hypothetical protein
MRRFESRLLFRPCGESLVYLHLSVENHRHPARSLAAGKFQPRLTSKQRTTPKFSSPFFPSLKDRDSPVFPSLPDQSSKPLHQGASFPPIHLPSPIFICNIRFYFYINLTYINALLNT